MAVRGAGRSPRKDASGAAGKPDRAEKPGRGIRRPKIGPVHAKVAGAGLGAVSVAFVVAVLRWTGIEVPEDVAVQAGSLVTLLGTALVKSD